MRLKLRLVRSAHVATFRVLELHTADGPEFVAVVPLPQAGVEPRKHVEADARREDGEGDEHGV